MDNQRGFTLIELVVVITVLGILSAVALSRYINIQQQARIAKAEAIYGTVRTAAALAKAVCVVDLGGVSLTPTCTATGGTVDMDGTNVAMVNQYPAAAMSGIIAASQIVPAADNVSITTGNPIIIDINGGTPPNCRISYNEAVAGAAPIVNLDISGC